MQAEEGHYTNQPGQLPDTDPDPDATKDVKIAGANLKYAFQFFPSVRIDWLPSQTIYSYTGSVNNASSTTTISKNVPATTSAVVLNVWSNGDPNFSNGPPKADAIATVQSVQLYFNSTTLSEASFTSACQAAGNVDPCSV
ncbi:hypothetical protein DFH07DRAFT_957142 [Mycena maculata]|uniref:GH16 domain-containing protein n=1 Tax=Mycena maculata TaxID=230809 RepID=A0AAD7JBV7_9AGAR|nr:hypothetical protein DFH07DRAFT_957142 [Mycena maculata]